MDHSTAGATLCERCSLLKFDDSATGCREVVDKEGVARLSFEDAQVEGRPRGLIERGHEDDHVYRFIQLEWHLDDSFPALPQLSISSQAGCEFCRCLHLNLEEYLVKKLKIADIREGPIALTMYLSLREESLEGFVVEGVCDLFKGEDPYEIMLCFPAEASPGKSVGMDTICPKADAVFQGCQNWLGAEPVRHDSYLAPENTSQMCRMLAECTTNCHPWKASFLPTRLIDIGTGSCDIPRLVLSSDVLDTMGTKYAALSYCWGDKQDAKTQLKTETATLERRLKGIPCEMMTPAIRDAVELTRAIGLRYIWIDALCIVQDDATDWSYESGQMNRVFHGAFVTFCGLHSTSCHESFLTRARTLKIPFHSTLQPTINGYFSIRLQPFVGGIYDRDMARETYEADLVRSQWNRRAWTYQEAKLSTRLLLLGSSKIHFRCGTHQWSEGDEKLSRLHESDFLLHDRIAGIKQGEFPVSSLYANWDFLVADYCNRSLTNTEDRLPAISGLAQLVCETLGDHYLAGFWKSGILKGLAWKGTSNSYSLQNHLQNIRERNYIAPSWSWAACVGWVKMETCASWQAISECTLLDAEVKTDLHNPFGRVYGGYLRIRGKVAPIPSALREDYPDDWDEWSRTWYIALDRDEVDEWNGIEARLDWRHRLGYDEEGQDNLLMLLHQEQFPREPTSGFPDSVSTTQGRVLTALMLYPTEVPDEYYRVGSISSAGEAGYSLMRTWFEVERDEKLCTII